MHIDFPSVSVIIPAYNARVHIGEAIDSVLAQGYENLEIIVVDDGSGDGTADFVTQHYPAVQLIRKANGGAATARNAGLRAASGEYIAFLDADDLWLPGKLNAQLRYLTDHPDILMLCTRFTFWLADDQGEFPPPDSLPIDPSIPDNEINPALSGWIYHKLLLDSMVWTSTVVMHRSLFDQLGEFDESLRLGQDYDYWLRAARITPIHTLRRPFALYRQHPASATARGATINYGAIVISKAVKRWGTASPNGESVPRRLVSQRLAGIHFSNGYSHYKHGNYPQAFKDLKHAVLKHPLSAKSWIYLILASAAHVFNRTSHSNATR
jgi:glycosyltransferase involved in cell wall biosynthesis